MTTLPFRTGAEIEAAMAPAVGHLRAGGLIAYPTETVYGFGSLLQADALDRLARLKARASDKAFLLLVPEAGMLSGLAWTPAAERLAAAFWPGPLTLVLSGASGQLPSRVTGAGGTVAIRATPHHGIRRLLERLGEPITSTSANAPGGEPARSAARLSAVLEQVSPNDEILILDGGPLPPSPPSTIVDCSVDPPVVLRTGAIPLAQLAEIDHGIRTLEPVDRGR